MVHMILKLNTFRFSPMEPLKKQNLCYSTGFLQDLQEIIFIIV